MSLSFAISRSRLSSSSSLVSFCFSRLFPASLSSHAHVRLFHSTIDSTLTLLSFSLSFSFTTNVLFYFFSLSLSRVRAFSLSSHIPSFSTTIYPSRLSSVSSPFSLSVRHTRPRSALRYLFTLCSVFLSSFSVCSVLSVLRSVFVCHDHRPCLALSS